MRRDEISETAFATVARRVITVMHRFRIKTKHKLEPVAKQELEPPAIGNRRILLHFDDVAT